MYHDIGSRCAQYRSVAESISQWLTSFELLSRDFPSTAAVMCLALAAENFGGGRIAVFDRYKWSS